MKGILTTEEELDQIPLPDYRIGNYTTVTHTKALNTVRESLKQNDLKVKKEQLYRTFNGQFATGVITLDLPTDSESEAIVIFENSYDKSRSFRLYVALKMSDSKNIIILGNSEYSSYKRVHKGSANEAIDQALLKSISEVSKNFSFLVNQKQQLKDILVDRVDIMQMLGEIFFDEELLNSEQVNHVRINLNNPKYSFNYLGSSLFFIYMLAASALEERGKTIGTYYDSHKGLNEYFARKLQEFLEIAEFQQEMEETDLDESHNDMLQEQSDLFSKENSFLVNDQENDTLMEPEYNTELEEELETVN